MPTTAPVKKAKSSEERPAEPSEATFWQRYNAHLEFPTSLLFGIFSLSVIFGFIVLVLVAAMAGGKDKKSVPIRLVEAGFDDEGAGSAGSGGVTDPINLAKTEAAPQQKDFEQLPLPNELPQVREDIQKKIQIEDPSATLPLSDEKAASYGALDQALRDKMLGIGQKRGAGGGAGSGDSGQAGTGPGGTGASSTRARALRWILRFSTRNGRDYIDQLQALGAVVMVPLPPDNKQMYIFRDLANPKPGTIATDAEILSLSQQIQFCDFKRDSVVAVSDALHLNFTPSQFWAFFPKGLEDELARLEVAYKNKRPEDVEETIFVVTVRNGKYQLVVADQKMKR